MPLLATASVRNTLRRFRRNRRGSAAVEFALVAPVFFALLFAIIETAIMFFATQVLETMTQDAARAVLTGQAQSGAVSACQVAGQPAGLPLGDQQRGEHAGRRAGQQRRPAVGRRLKATRTRPNRENPAACFRAAACRAMQTPRIASRCARSLRKAFGDGCEATWITLR